MDLFCFKCDRFLGTSDCGYRRNISHERLDGSSFLRHRPPVPLPFFPSSVIISPPFFIYCIVTLFFFFFFLRTRRAPSYVCSYFFPSPRFPWRFDLHDGVQTGKQTGIKVSHFWDAWVKGGGGLNRGSLPLSGAFLLYFIFFSKGRLRQSGTGIITKTIRTCPFSGL